MAAKPWFEAYGKQLVAITYYLKHEVKTHIDSDDNPVYIILRVLVRCSPPAASDGVVFKLNTSIEERRAERKCRTCQKPFQFIATLRDALGADVNNGLEHVIKDSAEKIQDVYGTQNSMRSATRAVLTSPTRILSVRCWVRRNCYHGLRN